MGMQIIDFLMFILASLVILLLLLSVTWTCILLYKEIRKLLVAPRGDDASGSNSEIRVYGDPKDGWRGEIK